MPNVKSKTSKFCRYHRFFRFFRREKAPLIDVNYSYQYMMRFPRLPITVPPFVPTLMSYRWNDDDEYHATPTKFLRNSHQQQQQHVRRRFSKRYSDLVGPSSARIYLPRKNSSIQEKQSTLPLPTYSKRQSSLKRKSNGNLSTKNSIDLHRSLSKTKQTEPSNIVRRYHTKTKHYSCATNSVDLLAHRMQAAMSTELMHSLDRNLILNEKKTIVNRSQSLHFSTQPIDDWWQKSSSNHLIPRVKQCFDNRPSSISTDEPTPDYDELDEEIHIRTIENTVITKDLSVDYDEPNLTPTYELEDMSATPENLGLSSSIIAPQTTTTPSSEVELDYQPIFPPKPPPLPNSFIEQNKITFRCRTIADQITTNHKLILKDEIETKKTTTTIIDEKSLVQPPSPRKFQSARFNLSKELLTKTTLRKVSHPVSRSYSTYGSVSQFNDTSTKSTSLCQKISIIDEQPSDHLSSSATTSIVIENEFEHKKSSKIYNDYKQRASSINLSTAQPSAIIHPMHTHIGLRSSTSSSSTNDKLNEINICVMNQLNQHLTTRFQKQQDNSPKKPIIIDEKSDIYDEPQSAEPSIPPPPPPLPIGGFRSISNLPERSLSSQRTSVMTLTRDVNSTGTSTTSSKLSDTRILRELRANPLFTKAKQHLEIDSEEQVKPIENSPIRSDQITANIHSELELIFQKRAQRNVI